MKIKNNVAKAAVAAGLSIAMTLSGIAPATMAWAATTGTGNVTISKRAEGDTTSILGYQIFTADVTDKTDGKVASNLDWANDEVMSTVLGQITAVDSAYNSTSAQDAADWLNSHANGYGTATVVNSSDVFGKIAKALRENSKLQPTTINPDVEAKGLSAGYWLFVTDSSTTANTDTSSTVNQVGTAPIFTIVGGNDLTVSQKTNLPTVTKDVKNDKSGSDWGKVADSEVEQNLEYRLQGTVADVIASYDTYYYKFTDTLDAGLTADQNSVVVKVKNGDAETTVKSGYTTNLVTNENGTSTLTVEFTDLKKATDENGTAITINKDSVVNVYYNAKLDKTKAYQLAGNSNNNTVKLTYSNNPLTDSKGDTSPASVKDYTYKFALTKKDSSTDSLLANASFTIQATGADEGAGTQYVQADGSLGSEAHTFTTDENGVINVSGLDAGTYTVVETQAPTGYNTVPTFTFTITPVFDETQTSLNKLAATVDSSSATIAVAKDESTAVDTVNLTVEDKAGSGLPLTGQAGVTLTWIAGGTVLAIGLAHLIRSRKEQNQE